MTDTPRKFVEQLPVVNQTDTLKNFFGATVDHLFQAGASETLTGYIGQKPDYYDSTKDFYIPEKDTKREYYQLEPTMVSKVSGNIAYTLFYDDMINYLDSLGANTVDHSRMFSGDYYSWSPPINLDAINNPNLYLWMGDLTDEEYEKTLLNMKAPRNVYFSDGVQTTFTLPAVIYALGSDAESPSVLVNGVEVTSDIVNGQAVIAATPAGSIIEVIRYGDIRKAYEGTNRTIMYPFQFWEPFEYAINTSNVYAKIVRHYNVGEVVYVGDTYGGGNTYICVTEHDADSTFNAENWKLIDATTMTTGLRVRLLDGVSLGMVFFVDGVGAGIQLIDDHTQDIGSGTPLYVVNDRRSASRDPWAIRNLWVNQQTLKWCDLDLSARKAARPIIEFLPNIELYNYGTRRLADVQAIITTEDVEVIDNWDFYPFDDSVVDFNTINLANINGKFFGEIDGHYVGSIISDGGYILQPNDRILLRQANVGVTEGLNQRIYRVIANEQTTLASGGNATVIEFISEGAPEYGDIVRLVPGNGTPTYTSYTDYYTGLYGSDFTNTNDIPGYFDAYETDEYGNPVQAETSNFNNYSEFWFNGEEWIPAQSSEGFPLFQLYDSGQNKLDDELTYPDSTFVGSKLFGYEIGNGTVDSILGISTVLNEYDKHVFRVYSQTERVYYDTATEIKGYYYHHILDTNEFSNNWFLNPAFSEQTYVTDGVYSIPLNLQANPNNLEVETIDKNKWFDHFNSIMVGQSNFAGSAYSYNNYRDTERYFGYGDYIIQHRNPLLKTMLTASNANFDLVSALNFVEHEYSYFKEKFNSTIITFLENGTLTTDDSADAWVEKILYNIRLNKTSDSPFSLSKMGGGQYYIPPTPASMGLSITRKPTFFYDETFGGAKFIVGHDGSLTPAFGDFRDDIILALELLIYNNIDSTLVTERPIFDLNEYVYTLGEYTQDDLTAVMESSFYKWSEENGVDYRPNTTFDSGNYFTWNFSSAAGRDGATLPGNWRGIYFKYFDTDRPNTNPWEMVGFTEKPVWWDIEYGQAPYTRGNTKLWDDMAAGYIRQGDRAGYHARYVRDNLYAVLPVTEEGELMDPVACHLVTVLPLASDAAAEWTYGDCGPVEYLWRISTSYYFALAIASFLMKPSKFVEEGWDTINNRKIDNGQYINLTTGNRPKNSELYVHGEFKDKERVYACGVQQFISEYIISLGADPATFGDAVRGLDVMLGHKMGGFTAVSDMTATTDNFGIIPSDDVNLVLYKSAPIKNDYYSGVIVVWTGRGYRVVGYDSNEPWFTIIPPRMTGPKTKLSLTQSSTTYNEWRPTTNYSINSKISYNGKVYVALKTHLSSGSFEIAYWNEVGSVSSSQDISVILYGEGEDETMRVPYGTTFYNLQDVSDFLMSHQRYMVSRGWVFDELDNGSVVDWQMSVQDFLEWAQVEWEEGIFIALSPATYKAKYQSEHGIVSDVLKLVNGKKGIIGKTGISKTQAQVGISRLDDITTFQSIDNDIYGIRIQVKEIEHAVLFNNETIFGNLIYNPLFNLRQARIRVLGRRSTDWTGRLDAPGYVLVDNEIVSNFMKSTDDFMGMYDIEDNTNSSFTNQARHNIGYDRRDYLSNLAINEIQQFEFYQGMIKQKGSVTSFDKLLRSDYIDQNRDLVFSEEWAFKIDQYAGVSRNKYMSVLVEQSDMNNDAEVIHFSIDNAVTNNTCIELVDNSIEKTIDDRWIIRADDPLHVFQTRKTYVPIDTDLPMTGYVRTSEVSNIVFNYTDIEDLDSVDVGDTIWVHAVDTSRGLTPENTQWYFIGNFNNSTQYWDTSTLTLTTNSAYIVENADGDTVFRTSPQLAPFITTSAGMVAEVGKTYKTEFRIRKIAADTNGKGSYVRPAFDVYNANGVLTSVNTQGDRYGFGYSSSSDMINTTDWVIGTYYTVGATWVAPSSLDSSMTIVPRIRMNRNLSDTAPWSTAMYEISEHVTFEEDADVYWNVFKTFNLSADGVINTISNIVVAAESTNVSTVRISMANAHGLTESDIGRYVYIDGDTQTEPPMAGYQQIAGVGGTNHFEILTLGAKGFDFSTVAASAVPTVRVLKPTRFKDTSIMWNSTYPWKDGDLAYVDGDDNNPWKVYSYTSSGNTYTQDDYSSGGSAITVVEADWQIVRSQPKRLDVSKFKSALVYDRQTKVSSTELSPEPLIVNRFNLISPATGYIFGKAKNEIDFMTDLDPAVYAIIGRMDDTAADETNGVNVWNKDQLGYVWWDLSTVRFLENETDDIVYGLTNNDRYMTELNYRKDNLSVIAPACSVDIYEWVSSTDLPENYTGVGELRYDYTRYSTDIEYVNGIATTMYYFWVKNATTVPAYHGRKLSTYAVAELIRSPKAQDFPWIAPLNNNSFLFGGVRQYLDDAFDNNSGTVIQIEHDYEYDGVVHEEWVLLKEYDKQDEIPDWLWDGLRDNVVGFDDRGEIIPAPAISPTVNNQPNKAPIWRLSQ